MEYDLEFNEALVQQCKELTEAESLDDWRLFCETVLMNMDKVMTMTLLKIIKYIIMYPSLIGKSKWVMNKELAYLIYGDKHYSIKEVEKSVLRRGFFNIIEIEVEMREWKKGKSHKHDPAKAGGKNKL